MQNAAIAEIDKQRRRASGGVVETNPDYVGP